MASLIILPATAVAAGACLAVAVPVMALKETIEKRSKNNFKKHLGRRSECKVNFGDLDAPIVGGVNKLTGKPVAGSNYGCSGKQSLPPTYDSLFHPPPPYGKKK